MDEPVDHGKKVKLIIQLAGLWMLAGLAQPLTFLLIGFLICVYILIWIGYHLQQQTGGLSTLSIAYSIDLWRQKLAPLAAAAGLPVLFSLVQFWMIIRDPFLQAWSAQNIIRSPHPLYYLLAYGLLIPYAWAGWPRLKATHPAGAAFLGAWMFLLPVLAYFPVNLQRRLPEGVWIAWIVLSLAALSAGKALEKPKDQQVRRLVTIGLGLAFPSTLILIWMGFVSAAAPSEPVFLPAAQVQAYEQFNQLAQPGQVVLGAYPTGNALPAYAPVRVVIGHGPESAGLSELLPQVEAFYQPGTNMQDRFDWICSQGVNYVFWGPHERRLGDWQPVEMPGFRKIYENADVQVFQVEISCP
jgi:hypothetical protein